MWLKVKVISDGTASGTRVLDADTGEPITNVREVYFNHGAGEEPKLIVELVGGVELQFVAPDTDEGSPENAIGQAEA